VFADLTFDICKDSGIIQLRNLVDPTIVYSKFHSEAVGNVWETHHEFLAKLISEYSEGKNVLELGGSDSRLAVKCLENVNKWTIMDPVLENKIDNPKLDYIEGFFGANRSHNRGYDMIVHSHTFEHILSPMEFLMEISLSLKEGDYHIFSVPNLYKYLSNKYVNTINFEHTILLAEDFIDYMLSDAGFKIIKKRYYGDHSIFYVTQKNQNVRHKKLPDRYIKYKKLYLDSYNYYQNFITNLNIVLKETDKTVYMFGGHVFSQYLIALGLDTSKITCILDNSELKRGKRLYGTTLYIKSPNDVILDENSLIILKVGQYRNEIRKQLLDINKCITFYE
jgi:hypothetical protein